jgi:hypothetical protein
VGSGFAGTGVADFRARFGGGGRRFPFPSSGVIRCSFVERAAASDERLEVRNIYALSRLGVRVDEIAGRCV